MLPRESRHMFWLRGGIHVIGPRRSRKYVFVDIVVVISVGFEIGQAGVHLINLSDSLSFGWRI